MIEKGTKVRWQGVSRIEEGEVIGHYVEYIVRLDNGKVVMVGDRSIIQDETELHK